MKRINRKAHTDTFQEKNELEQTTSMFEGKPISGYQIGIEKNFTRPK